MQYSRFSITINRKSQQPVLRVKNLTPKSTDGRCCTLGRVCMTAGKKACGCWRGGSDQRARGGSCWGSRDAFVMDGTQTRSFRRRTSCSDNNHFLRFETPYTRSSVVTARADLP